MYYEFGWIIPGNSYNLTKIGLTKIIYTLTRSKYFFNIYGSQNVHEKMLGLDFWRVFVHLYKIQKKLSNVFF